MADDHKLLKNVTGVMIEERLREIRNVMMDGVKNKGTVYGFHIDGT